MTPDEQTMVLEPERSMDEYRMLWEGEREEDIDVGDAHILYLPVRWEGVNGLVVRHRYDPDRVDRRLDELCGDEVAKGRRYLWVVGPSATPSDLGERLLARGYVTAVEWDGMILTDFSSVETPNSDVVVEALSTENAEGFARARSEDADDQEYAERLDSARRFIDMDDRNHVHIHVARLANEVVGYVILRAEPGGPGYFRDAYTLKAARRHGAYLALVERRLEIVREAGCTFGVVQANRQTSSPILLKRGWKPVSAVTGYALPDPDSPGW